MAKENESHIGIVLKLDNPSDMLIHQILESRPAYISKTAYIKRAVMYYSKHFDENALLSDISQNKDPLPVDNEINLLNEDCDSTNKEKKSVNAKKKEESSKIAKTKKERPVVTDKKEGSNSEKTKEELSVDTDDLVVNNNSDIGADVDYEDFLSEFFK